MRLSCTSATVVGLASLAAGASKSLAANTA